MPNPNLAGVLGALAGRPLLLDERFLAASYSAQRSTDAPLFESRNGVAIVSISGPLAHHTEHSYYAQLDSYDAIRKRVVEAFASRPRAVVLSLDTPGGECSGCFELARDMRVMAAKAGIPLYASVDGMACSAGYALACAASRIYAPATAIVGSIGVITGLLSAHRALENFGIEYEVIASGDRKGDGHPAKPIDDGARGATKGLVMSLADVFFAWVGESRPALGAEGARALQAGIVLGKDAVNSGLIDQVATLDQVIAIAGKPPVAAAPPAGAAKTTTGAGPRARGKETSMGGKKSGGVRLEGEATEGETPAAEAESVDLASLRAAMEMPDQPGQEVVDAAAARISEGDGDGEEPAEESAEAKALRGEVAALTSARTALEQRVVALEAELSTLRPIAAAKVEGDLVAELEAEMRTRGMATTGERRDEIVAIAKEYGKPAALRAIKLAHVPPAGSPVPGKTVRHTPAAPEAGVTNDAQKAAQNHAIATEEAAIRAAHPGKPAHTVYREAHAAARKKHPELFARAN